jgi:uncharacterized repeat protein (TIGR01451 family)
MARSWRGEGTTTASWHPTSGETFDSGACDPARSRDPHEPRPGFHRGDQAVYTVTVTNVGLTETAGNVTVTDVLPPGLTYRTGKGNGWTCPPAEQVVTELIPFDRPRNCQHHHAYGGCQSGGVSPTNLAAVMNGRATLTLRMIRLVTRGQYGWACTNGQASTPGLPNRAARSWPRKAAYLAGQEQATRSQVH